ncbi:flagellin [Halanaerobium hydrogeniformans]|uniref:Flagellin n=1 Tax=Halanaerobium hydrogeniformans TaxID=656519 RepID=E4RPI9_HALHG|nr:flagellin [Halanaerobium hydrogeniformans]ADQ14012.1 flagellin domain protein [Halanaerobium hydrogeniformans]
MIINTNATALNTYNKVNKFQKNLRSSLERLSSGKRINKAADDAAGLAISQKMNGQVRGTAQAQRNVQDGISLLQTAEGGLAEIQDPPLQRMRELALQAANDTYTENDRKAMQNEFDEMKNSIDDIANNTEFNTQKLLNVKIESVTEVDSVNGTDETGSTEETQGTEESQKVEPVGEWVYNEYGQWTNAISVDSEGNSYVGYYDGTIIKLNSNGDEIFNFKAADNAMINEIEISLNDNIVITSNDETVKKLDPDQNTLWVFNDHYDHVKGLAIDNNNNIITGSRAGPGNYDTIRKKNSSGDEIWRYSLPSEAIGTLDIVSDENN